MSDTPKVAFPVISEATVLRFRLGLVVATIGGIIGGTVWLTNLANNQSRIETKVDYLNERIGLIETYFGLRAPLPRTGAAEATKERQP